MNNSIAMLKKLGFVASPQQMRVLTEEKGRESPTRANILSAMKWLTQDAKVSAVAVGCGCAVWLLGRGRVRVEGACRQ